MQYHLPHPASGSKETGANTPSTATLWVESGNQVICFKHDSLRSPIVCGNYQKRNFQLFESSLFDFVEEELKKPPGFDEPAA